MIFVICGLFVDIKPIIHFGEDKTKSILYASKFKRKNINKLLIKYGHIQIKQYSKVNSVVCNIGVLGHFCPLGVFWT